MRRRSVRIALVLAIVVSVVLGCMAGVAYAVPPSLAWLPLMIGSPGSGSSYSRNTRDIAQTSPVQGTYPQIGGSYWYGWYNQDVSLTGIVFETPGYVGIPLSHLAYSYNGSAYTSITASPLRTFSAEGIYAFDATGTLSAVSYEGTGSMGIDKTRPSSSSNMVPVYDNSAVITITATDTLSGPQFIVYSLDGASDYATDTPDLNTLSGDVFVHAAGWHTLRWFTIDNAGNFEHSHQVSFLINASGYTPVLGKPHVSVRKGHTATFTGSVTPGATNKMVALTLQRKSGKSFKPFATYSVKVPKYASAYAIVKYITKAGTYHVKAAEGAGASVWSKNFTIK